MYSITAILGVMPGYFIENPSPDEAVKMASDVFRKYGTLKNAEIYPTDVIYPRELGAPEGGEIGVHAEFCGNDEKSITDEFVRALVDLGQIDAALIFSLEEKTEFSVQVHNIFAENEVPSAENFIRPEITRTDDPENMYRDIVLKSNDLKESALRLQTAMEIQMNDENLYVTNGTLTPKADGIHFLLAENASFGRTSHEKYRDSLKWLLDNYT